MKTNPLPIRPSLAVAMAMLLAASAGAAGASRSACTPKPASDDVRSQVGDARSAHPSSRAGPRLPMKAAELEERNFGAAYRDHRGDAALMAEALGVSRMTVYRWLERRSAK